MGALVEGEVEEKDKDGAGDVGGVAKAARR